MSKAKGPTKKATANSAGATKPAGTATAAKSAKPRTRKPAAKAAKSATASVAASRRPEPAAAKPLTNGAVPPTEQAAAAIAETTEAVNTALEPAEATVAAAAEAMEESAAIAKDAMEAVAAETEKAVSASIEQASTAAKATAIKAFPEAADGLNALFDLQRSAVDAWIKAGTVAAKTMETMGKDIAALNQATFDAALKNGEKLLDCRTFQDVVELQTDFATERMSAFVAKGSEFSERAMSAADEVRAPIQAQVEKAFAAARPG